MLSRHPSVPHHSTSRLIAFRIVEHLTLSDTTSQPGLQCVGRRFQKPTLSVAMIGTRPSGGSRRLDPTRARGGRSSFRFGTHFVPQRRFGRHEAFYFGTRRAHSFSCSDCPSLSSLLLPANEPACRMPSFRNLHLRLRIYRAVVGCCC